MLRQTINIIAMLGVSHGLNGKCLHALLFDHVVKEGMTGKTYKHFFWAKVKKK